MQPSQKYGLQLHGLILMRDSPASVAGMVVRTCTYYRRSTPEDTGHETLLEGIQLIESHESIA